MQNSLTFTIAAGWLAMLVLAGWPGLSRAEGTSATKRSVELYYTVTVDEIPVDAGTVKAWVPVPQSDLHQEVVGYRVIGDYFFKEVTEDDYNNRFLMVDLEPAKGGNAEFTVVFAVDRVKVDGDSGYDMDASMNERYLLPDSMVPLDGEISAEAKAVVGDEIDPLRQARLLYDHLVESVVYDKSGEGWGRGDALYACDVRKGNCTDFHSLFIGEARSLGIPARFHMGIPFQRDATEGDIGGYHCWAEFYIDGLGWVPVDASEANKDKSRTDELFGGLDASRIEFVTGRDMMIPGSAQERVNFVIYPHVEADGEKLSAGKAFRFKDR